MNPLDAPLPADLVEQSGVISVALRDWYAVNHRDLPWRRTRDPYHIWLSEIMLQQTTVKTVIHYYHAFLERFPSVRALAEAPIDDVLARWSGLGYYSRARNLHRAAGAVMQDHGGKLPSDPIQLRSLPGIGEYTQGAILSIAFDLSHPLVDGNVVRVLSRLAGWKGDPKSGPLTRKVKELAARLVPATCAGDHNQGLMELGATLCSPLEPQCSPCPFRRWCRAAANGEPASYPGVAKRAPSQTHALTQLHAVDGRSVFLVKRKETTVLDGMWELPTLPADAAPPAATGEEVTVTHTIMNRRYKVTVRPVAPCDGKQEGQWVPIEDLPGLPLTGLTLKILRKLGTIPPR